MSGLIECMLSHPQSALHSTHRSTHLESYNLHIFLTLSLMESTVYQSHPRINYEDDLHRQTPKKLRYGAYV